MKDRIIALLAVGLAATLGMTTAAGILILLGILVVLPRVILGDLLRRRTAKLHSGKEGSGPCEPLP